MSRIDLHPEDLIDREALGELTPREEQHLEEHRSHCCGLHQRSPLETVFPVSKFFVTHRYFHGLHSQSRSVHSLLWAPK